MSAPTIIVADPDDAVRKSLCYVLGHEGFTVREATSAEDTTRATQSGDIALVILSTAFWKNDDFDALAVIRRNPATKTLPVFLFGNLHSKEEAIRASRSGASAVILRRGFDIEPLLVKVRAALEAETTTSSAPKRVERLTSAHVREALSGIRALPAMEFNIAEALTGTSSSTSDVKGLADVVSRDPMLAVAILSHANSVEQKRSRDYVADIHEAVSRMGPTECHKLLEFIPSQRGIEDSSFDLGRFWIQAVARERIARMLSETLQVAAAGEAAACALLLDAGYMVLATLFSEQFETVFHADIDDDVSPFEFEKHLIGCHHGDMADLAFERFGLPALIREIVRTRHDPTSLRQTAKSSVRLVSMIVQGADQLVNALLPSALPFITLDRWSSELGALMETRHVSGSQIVDESRKVVAELVTEMTYLFPESANSPFFHSNKLWPSVVYHGGKNGRVDVFRLFLDARSKSVTVLDQFDDSIGDTEGPILVDLSESPPGDQIEPLAAIRSNKALRERKGVLILPPSSKKAKQFPEGWMLATLPTRPDEWLTHFAEAQA